MRRPDGWMTSNVDLSQPVRGGAKKLLTFGPKKLLQDTRYFSLNRRTHQRLSITFSIMQTF